MRPAGGKKPGIDIEKRKVRKRYGGGHLGKVSVVGIGPGDNSLLSPQALKEIENSQVLVGYKTYIKLLDKELLKNKEIITSGMTQEVKRARYAVEKAGAGKRVCIISSGDPGIYGTAGVVLEFLEKNENKIDLAIIPGITAASGCASLLGAPLMNDFAVISLSDLLTDIQVIEKRVRLAAEGDFVIVFYNPQSTTRTLPLKRAWQILMESRTPQTPVGIVRNAYREEQQIAITKLEDMLQEEIDMSTTIIVGNSQTYIKGKYMITSRGYHLTNSEK